ncbi:hypothetical protein [Lamprocystis purpurea]|uniref:hypothetical protein n=1 Tax=Lamprocystis purpurea TaxID=61598 RepID=UPI0003618BF1|nr:hypothetical protein [Lamprocystis purpurea]
MNTSNDVLVVSGLFKARPAEEGGERILYMEASNEHLDLQGERVLAKSLQASSDYFLRYGVIDLDHRTQRSAAVGDNPYLWAIGQPIAVTGDDTRTLVKAQLYRGDSPVAANANMVWDSMTKVTPPTPWYPSVAGHVPSGGRQVDPVTQETTVTSVLWSNIGLSRTPVNTMVPPAAVMEAGVLAKCLMGGAAIKALEAGYGTDVATLTGGAAVRVESIDPAPQVIQPQVDYVPVREALARYLRSGGEPRPQSMAEHLIHSFHVPPDEASGWVERFLRDVLAHTQNRRSIG